jgi:hypothetical protein
MKEICMNARAVALSIAAGITLNLPAIAGPNDFFGGKIGGNNDGSQGSAAAVNTEAPTNVPPGDYTADEKRMQKKFKANVKAAQELIAKAEKMIKSSDTKLSKKGKIMKEIGEKRLAELKANNPFPEIAASGKRLQ